MVSRRIQQNPLKEVAPTAPNTIKLGWSTSLTGDFAFGAETEQNRSFKIWINETKDKGGIYLSEYGKRIPIEVITYDDKSDPGTCVQNAEKLILEDKVDVLLPSWGSTMTFAEAPVANKYGYPYVTPSCSVEEMRKMRIEQPLPYYFGALDMLREMAPSLAELLNDCGVKTAVIIHHDVLHGIEWATYVAPALEKVGIKVILLEQFPMGTPDLSPILKRIKTLNPDALLVFGYPPEEFLALQQTIAIDFNPKVYFGSVGPAFPSFRDTYGANVVEGIIHAGAWNAKISPEAKEFVDRFAAEGYGEPDYWCTGIAYGVCQVYEQAIDKAGLDREAIKNVLDTETFHTVVGPVKFGEDGHNLYFPGYFGQWQSGMSEVIAPKEKRTAEPIYPKPPWPK
jgi:branched-chain amino acid transport system substrate-binding protein